MSGQWKPGDVAMVGNFRAIFTDDGDRGIWVYGDGSSSPSRTLQATPVRRLVVIDPEDREQVERLRVQMDAALEVFLSQGNGPSLVVDAIQDALREFANPTPPKPEEPTGLGAVVLAHAGSGNREHVVRAGVSAERRPWVDQDGDWHSWTDLREVEIVSEGVTP